MNQRRILAVIAVWVSSANVPALQPAPSAPSIAILDVTVISMTRDAKPRAHQTILVKANRVDSIGSSNDIAVPAGALRIDGRGKYVLPGLADMHVHLEYFDEPSILGLFVANGVTSVRNMDGRPFILDWKRQIAAGNLVGPRLFTAGPLLDGDPPVRPDNTIVANAGTARAEVEAQVDAGYDFIKVYSALSRDAYEAILTTAKARGAPVVGHVPRAVGLDGVLHGGLASIEHLGDYAATVEADSSPFKGKGHWTKRYLTMPMDRTRVQAVASRLAAASIWSVPTLFQPEREILRPAAIDAHLRSSEVAYIFRRGRALWEAQTRRTAEQTDTDERRLLDGAHSNRLQLVGAFRSAGVAILAGTDTPNPFVVPGFSLHDELALLVEAGLTPEEALAAATREAARFLRRDDFGTIGVGKVADLLVLDGNPLERIQNTKRIAGVMLNGRWFGGREREEMLAALRQP